MVASETRRTFSRNSTLMDILRSDAGRAIVDRHLPGLSSSSQLHTLFGYPIELVAATDERLGKELDKLEALYAELERVPAAASAVNRDVAPRRGAAAVDDAPRGSAPVHVLATGRVFERIEVTLTGPSDGNPFIDVELTAAVSGPDGDHDVVGFYDGSGRYVIRWLPLVEGAYSFVSHSNVMSLDQVAGSVDVAPAAPGAHGPVRVSDRYHFAHHDGTPYLPFGTTSYAWVHQSAVLQDQTVEQLSRSPFNKMRMCVFPKSYLFNENEPEVFPYPRTPDGFDFARFEPVFWENLERRIDQLAGIGVEADLILFHAYDRWGFSQMSPAEDDRFVEYAVARLSSFANVWWSLANEFDLLFDKTEDDWERFAAIIEGQDPVGHLRSIHNCRDVYDQNRSWITHVSIQRTDVYKTAEMMDVWRDRWSKPVVLDETGYEGDIDQGWGDLTGEEMTRRFWEGTVRGGYVGHGETYVDRDDILWWSKGGVLKGTSPERIAFLRQIVESAPGGRLEPNTIDWDVPRAGVEGEYYLYYFGANQPSYRRFIFDPSVSYRVDLIDTWQMSIERVPGVHSGRFVIQLPARPYMALQLTAV